MNSNPELLTGLRSNLIIRNSVAVFDGSAVSPGSSIPTPGAGESLSVLADGEVTT
jgi:hypothetical protein